MKKKALIIAATELNDIMGFDPQIDVSKEATEEYLTKEIIESSSEIAKDDAFSEAANDVFKELKCGLFAGKKEKTENTPEDGLEAQLDAAKTLAAQKANAKANEEFKAIRGDLTKYKKKVDLREAL